MLGQLRWLNSPWMSFWVVSLRHKFFETRLPGGHPGLRALTHTPPTIGKKNLKMAPIQSSSHLQQMSYLLYKKFGRMCVLFSRTNIWFQASVLLNLVCILLTAECVCCIFLLSFIRCPGSFPNLLQCKDVGLLNGTPRFFLHGSFCMKKKKEACSVHKSDVKKNKKIIWETSFSSPSYPKNLSFAIIVICSTFVNTMFLIYVHRHECQYNCKRF